MSVPEPLSSQQRLLLTIALALGTFMEVLDSAIANVSIPTIAGSLAVSPNQGTWVISSYGLAAAIAVPLTGWLARRFGEVRTFTWSVLLFTLSSMLCGFAQSLPELVAFRLLQGLVSGPMVPLSQTLLMANYPPEKRGLAMALWAMTVVIAPICGPLLGGFITDSLSWPWIFYINLPVGLFCAIVSAKVLKGRESRIVKYPIDFIGLILLIIGVGSLQLMLDNGNELDWFNSSFITLLGICAVVSISYFIAWELTHPQPIVDLSLFKQRNFRYGVIALSFGYMCFFAMTIMFPLWLQTVMGYTSTWAGLATAPVGILALVFSPIVGKNIQRLNLRIVGSISFVIFAITSYWLSTFTLSTSFDQLLWPRFLQGIAIACFFVPMNQIILSGIAPDKFAAASGLSNFIRTLFGSFGTAIVVTIWSHRAQEHAIRLGENISTTNPASVQYSEQLAHSGVPAHLIPSFIQNLLQSQSLMLASSDIFLLISLVFLTLIGIVWLCKPPFTGGSPGAH